MLELNRFATAPSVRVLGKTTMSIEGVIDALDDLGQMEAAETHGTPINDLLARLGAGDSTLDDVAEFAGRQCYQSWGKGRSHADYIANIVEQQHGSVFEHAGVVTQISGVSRSFSHELVRHSIGTGISQESQRYVDAENMRFVIPPLMCLRLLQEHGTTDAVLNETVEQDSGFQYWREACSDAHEKYVGLQDHFISQLNELIENDDMSWIDKRTKAHMFKKRANEAARSVLPNAAETRIVYSMNMRAARHIILLRATTHADLEINRVALDLLNALRPHAPAYFSDLFVHFDGDTPVEATSKNGRI